jgi:MFS family permease
MNKDVVLVSFSAFFADLGYQTALAIFPVFLVLSIGAPAYVFGVANALAYGVGSFFGYLGGLLSDRYSDKKIAILGNALIPIISLMALTRNPVDAVLFFSGGWWARNFRTPSRRTILVEASSEGDRGKVFGFLHALDIGGGMLSVVMLLVLLQLGLTYSGILLLMVVPLVVSTLLLVFTGESKRQSLAEMNQRMNSTGESLNVAGRAYRGIIIATALYGFSSYSLGFPILTIAQSSNAFLGIGSYAVYLGISSVAGYYIGSRKWGRVKTLAMVGYVLSGLGTFVLGLAYFLALSVHWLYLAVAILGFGLGVIETLEPTLISLIKNEKRLGEGMGALAASRSFGIFFANVIMGLLYVFNPSDSYFYAAIVSILAGLIVFAYGRELKD